MVDSRADHSRLLFTNPPFTIHYALPPYVSPLCHLRHEFLPEESLAMPFCSERCRVIDLGRWLDERYGVAGEAKEEDEEGSRTTDGQG